MQWKGPYDVSEVVGLTFKLAGYFAIHIHARMGGGGGEGIFETDNN